MSIPVLTESVLSRTFGLEGTEHEKYVNDLLNNYETANKDLLQSIYYTFGKIFLASDSVARIAEKLGDGEVELLTDLFQQSSMRAVAIALITVDAIEEERKEKT